MICILRIEKLSPNTVAQPTGWILDETVAGAIRQADFVGETEIARQLRRLADDIRPGKYTLAEGVYALVS